MAIINDNPCENDKRYAVKAKGGIFPVHSFFANQYGLYCMQGNISEMTSEQGVAIGGNYLLPATEAHFNSKQNTQNLKCGWFSLCCRKEIF